MEAKEVKLECAFDMLFTRSVPHILEKIFFNLDYTSFKHCMVVSSGWHELLKSESYKKVGKVTFRKEIYRELCRAIKIKNAYEGIKILSSGMVDVTWPDSRGFTPLGLASRNGLADVVKHLLKEGAEIDKKSYGDSPLHIAAVEGYKDVAKLLLEGGAEIDMQDYHGSTPLHNAITCGHIETVKLLVSAGADLNARCFNGLTPRGCAYYYGHTEITNLLRVLGGIM